jgi:large subunit ribosomal protein L1
VGKASFPVEKLVENYGALLTELIRVKPSTAKGRYVKTVAVATTMGPGIKIDPLRTRAFMED